MRKFKKASINLSIHFPIMANITAVATLNRKIAKLNIATIKDISNIFIKGSPFFLSLLEFFVDPQKGTLAQMESFKERVIAHAVACSEEYWVLSEIVAMPEIEESSYSPVAVSERVDDFEIDMPLECFEWIIDCCIEQAIYLFMDER